MNLDLDLSDMQRTSVAPHPAALPLMRLTGASKLYDKGSNTREALRSVDLDIHRGEFTAIVGPSGSGKSALMKMLGLLEAPTSGGYRFQGVPEQSLSDELTGTEQGKAGIARALVCNPSLLLVIHVNGGAVEQDTRREAPGALQ